MAHRGEEESNASFVAPNVSGFLADFRHPHDIEVGIRAGEELGLTVKLITEDDENVADPHSSWDAVRARESYFILIL